MASLVDYLSSQKQDSSFSARTKLASQYGITGYTGTAAQNTQLLGLLQKQTAPVYGPTAPKTSLLSGSTATGTGNITQSPVTSIGASVTPTVDPNSLFSISRPDASTYTTNSSGFQVPKQMGALDGSTSYAGQTIKAPNTLPGSIAGRQDIYPTPDTSLQTFLANASKTSPVPTIPQAIPSDMLNRTDMPTLPKYTPTPAPSVPSFSEYMSGGKSISAPTSNDINPYEKQYDAIGNEILTSMDKLGTKAARKLELENQAGLSGYQKQLNDINGQLASLAAEALGKQLDAQGKPIANSFINRQVDAIEREKTVKALGLNAIAQTLQGNISLANDTVTKALDAEFQPITDKIEYLKVALQMNENKMTRAEKAKAAEQAIKLKEYEMTVENQREERKNIYNVMLEAAKNGADSSTLNAIRSAKTAKEAIGLAGSSLSKSGEMSSVQNANFMAISNRYNSDAIINNGSKALSTIQIADQVLRDPANATNQLKALYSLVTALDPNSAVKEGEVALAQQSQSFLSRFSTSLQRISNGQIVDPATAQAMAQASKDLAQVWSDAARRKEIQYSSQANVAGVGDAFGSFLSGSKPMDSQMQTQSSLPSFSQIQSSLKSRYPNASDSELAKVAQVLMNDPTKLQQLGFTNADRALSGSSITSINIGNKPIKVNAKIANPLALADRDFFNATGQHLRINESLRSTERQAQLYAAFKSGKGGRAAPPGKSYHETGKAVDIANWKAAEPYLRKYGFKNDLADDRNHFSIGEFA